MKKDPIVLILAGGAGKRFWPFITDKSIFPLLGEPVISRSIKQLAAAGFTKLVVVTNPENDARIRALSMPGVDFETIVQREPKGMGDAVLVARPRIAGRPLLVMNAEDMVEDALYERMAGQVKKAEPFVVGRKTAAYFDGGYLQLSQNRLVRIVEKPGEGNEPSNLINLVFHYFPNADAFIEKLARTKTSRDDQYEQALDAFAKEHQVSVLPYEGFWTPLKYPWHVLDAGHYLLHKGTTPRSSKKVDIRNNVIIEGAVIFGENVRIFENTKIVGPTYIGDHTIIGNNNLIRESIIGADCVTGFGTDITRSVIGDDCWFHSNFVGDSVLERNVSMGSGAVLANLRLDEGTIYSTIQTARINTHKTRLGAMIGTNVRIGVNASIMPGVKIGSNTFVGAGVIADRDIEEDSFCVASSNQTVTKNKRTVPSPSTRTFAKAKL